jgi:hypothetical protein
MKPPLTVLFFRVAGRRAPVLNAGRKPDPLLTLLEMRTIWEICQKKG